jgi:putative sterol carrier protein
MGVTFDELLELASRLNESRLAKNLMETFSRTIQFDLEGEEGTFYMTIDGGRMSIAKGVPQNPDIVMAGDGSQFVKVVRGKLDVTHTLAQGHMRVTKGKVSELTQFNRILVAANREVAR